LALAYFNTVIAACKNFLGNSFFIGAFCIYMAAMLFLCLEFVQLFAETVSKFGSLPTCLRRAMVTKFPEFDQYQLGESRCQPMYRYNIIMIQ